MLVDCVGSAAAYHLTPISEEVRQQMTALVGGQCSSPGCEQEGQKRANPQAPSAGIAAQLVTEEVSLSPCGSAGRRLPHWQKHISQGNPSAAAMSPYLGIKRNETGSSKTRPLTPVSFRLFLLTTYRSAPSGVMPCLLPGLSDCNNARHCNPRNSGVTATASYH